jgi:hypothetical protein
MTYRPLAREADATLHWRQPKPLAYRWVLASDDAEFGAMWSDAKWTGNPVLLETAVGRWRLVSEGLARWSVVAYPAEGNEELLSLVMTNMWLGNRAEFRGPDGVVAVWEYTSFWKGIAEVRSVNDTLLQTFRSGVDEGGVAAWWRSQCRVDFTEEGFAHPQRDLLCGMGWLLTSFAMNPAI